MNSFGWLMPIAASAITLLAVPAGAHEFWIDPQAQQGGGDLSADLRVGQDFSGIALPYLDTTMKTMTHVSPSGTRPIEARLGDRPAIQGLQVADEGLHLLTVETHPAYVVFDDLPAFADYLAYEGLSEIASRHVERGLSDTRIAEEYIRNARALVQIGPADGDDADRPTGMPFELVAVGSPFATDHDSLTVRLTWQGSAANNVQVAMFHVPENGDAPDDMVRVVTRTDPEGHARLELSGAGDYLLNAVRIGPVDGPGSVVWQSYWASLTFRLE